MSAQLERLVRRVQAQARIPSLSVALRRADRPLWTFQVGDTSGDVFRIGSITKTFTAVLVLQARDEGLLDLDDPLAKHLEVPAHGELTFRRLLSHTGGLQREPANDFWYSPETPDLGALIKELPRAEAVLPPARRFHYSNLAYALLGHAAAKVLGGQWWPLVAERICVPLGLESVSYDRPENAVNGFMVDAYSDHASPEPPTQLGALAPAGQLWSNAADLATWAAFLADPASVDPAGRVLGQQTLEEMRWPLTTRYETVWGMGVGLGLLLFPQQGEAMHVGHNGAMPGYLSAAFGRHGGADNPGGVSAAVLASSGTAAEIGELVHELINTAIEQDPMDIRPWIPGQPAPPQWRGVLGRWWGEGFEYVFRWSAGALTASGVDDPPGMAPAVFAPESDDPDILRTVSGREVGELLRISRNENGEVTHLHWATYRFTRHQETFDGVKL